MTPVIHAVPNGDRAYSVTSLLTGEQAVVVTAAVTDRRHIADWLGEHRPGVIGTGTLEWRRARDADQAAVEALVKGL